MEGFGKRLEILGQCGEAFGRLWTSLEGLWTVLAGGGTCLDALARSWKILKSPWETLESLDTCWKALGRYWKVLEKTFGQPWDPLIRLGSSGLSWNADAIRRKVLGISWHALELSWKGLGRCWNVLGRRWKPFEGLAKSWTALGEPRHALGGPWECFGEPRCVGDVLAMWLVTGDGREALRRAHVDHKAREETHASTRVRTGVWAPLCLTSALEARAREVAVC